MWGDPGWRRRSCRQRRKPTALPPQSTLSKATTIGIRRSGRLREVVTYGKINKISPKLNRLTDYKVITLSYQLKSCKYTTLPRISEKIWRFTVFVDGCLVGFALWVVGCGTWVVLRALRVTGRASRVVRCRLWQQFHMTCYCPRNLTCPWKTY